ncbi:MAG: hypothetical protein KAJ01_10630 [Candidatus Hydrogenedentes bacterium]|nr:hypothetical protein [Candidatus Hydrogenedentota bacterium]
MYRVTFASGIRGAWIAPALAVAFSLFWESACAAQGAMDLPGGENFKEMRITGGERLILLGGKLKSIEENTELRLIAASEENENLTVRADRIDFFYAESADEPARIVRVVADGNVSFVMESTRRVLRGDKMTWFVAENKVEFAGNPAVVTEDGTLTGRSIVHYLDEGRTVVEKPRGEFLIPEKEDTKEESKTEEEKTP